MADLGIIFLHHEINDVVLNNLQMARQHNPNATIVTVSANRPLSGGYTLDATPKIKQWHSKNPKYSPDWLVCSWYLQRREDCERWWIVEWDTFPTVSVEEYYKPVLSFPMIVPSVRLLYRDPGWVWFKGIQKMPEEFKPYAIGAVPFLYLVSGEALKNVCNTMLKKPFRGTGELRFPTVANKCGFTPCGYSPPNDKITWIPWIKVTGEKAIFHPVKYFVKT